MKKKLMTTLSLLAAICVASYSQTKFDGTVMFDRTVNDFGDILESAGPVSCEFEVTNIGSKPMSIQNVLSSCGCTRAEWTKEAIAPGQKGIIKGTYQNDQGPYPFDKSLTVYLSTRAKPVVLYLRGNVMEKKLPLAEIYKVRFGQLGTKSDSFKCGNLTQGQQKSGEETIANLGETEASVIFENVSPGLSLKVFPNPVPAGAKAKLIYTVTSSRERWGKNHYYATPVINGKPDRNMGKIDVWAITVDDFSSVSDPADKTRAPMLEVVNSSFDISGTKIGKKVNAKFVLFNYGESELKIYDAFSDTEGVIIKNLPTVKPGEREVMNVEFDTTGQQKGEKAAIISLVTNSPLRPIATVHIVGVLK